MFISAKYLASVITIQIRFSPRFRFLSREGSIFSRVTYMRIFSLSEAPMFRGVMGRRKEGRLPLSHNPVLVPELTQSLSILALYDTRDELGTGQWRLYLENKEVVVMNYSNGTCFSFFGR